MKDNAVKIEREYLMALMVRDSLPDFVRLDPEELSVVSHREVLRSIYDCEEAHGAWGAGTVLHYMYLQKSKHCATMENIAENIELIAEAEPRAEMIREVARARMLHGQADMVVEAFDENRVLDGLGLAQELAEMQAHREEGYRTVDIAQALSLARIEVGRLIEGKSSRLRFNIDLLDRGVGGVTPGSMTTIGGTTGSGKSSLSLLLAVRMARKGTRIGIVSLEDPETLWGDRLLSLLAGIPTSWLYTGAGLGDFAVESFKDKADSAELGAKNLPIRLCICTGARASEVVNEAKKLVRSHHCGALLVDYLQAARFDLGVQRYDKSVADLSKSLKGLCNKEGIPLIVTSQLRRRQGTPYVEPHISDIKESGDIENESEVVILLWQDSDKPNAKCLGKIAKVKWSQPGLRFELERDPTHGMIVGLKEWKKGEQNGS